VNDTDMFDEAVRLVAQGQPVFADLVTHRFALDDYRVAFDLADTGQSQAVKVAFVL